MDVGVCLLSLPAIHLTYHNPPNLGVLPWVGSHAADKFWEVICRTDSNSGNARKKERIKLN
jgi:hypothetical protein